MNFSVETGVPVLTVLIQGLISFLSPCILPLLPLYIGYLSGGTKTVNADGTIHYPRGKVMVNTLFFVLGISFAFFLLGAGATALGSFFTDNRLWFARIGGIIMILFGIYQLGWFGRSSALDAEHKLPFNLDRWSMGPVPALLLGFTFSFAWTPCVGPTLTSVLLMAASASTTAAGYLLIGVYTLGFVLPFLLVGLFTSSVLDFFGKHQNIVRWTVKIGAILLILMGVMTLTGFMNNITGYMSGTGNTTSSQTEESSQNSNSGNTQNTGSGNSQNADSQSTQDSDSTGTSHPAAADFTLTDQYGNTVTLSDYKGKTVFLNFWATWCPPCRSEMPDIQALYEKYGSNSGDLIVLGVAAPNYGREGSREDITSFLSENGYTYPVVFSDKGQLFETYGISSFPTTFMIDKDGNVYGSVSGALTADNMESIVQQTMDGSK